MASFLTESAQGIAEVATLTVGSFAGGGKLLVCGNGGSAADAQHLAAEFVGRFLVDRKPLPAIALTDNTSTLTAVGNDYGFAAVFERGVRAHGRAGDVVVGISTSGRSPNVLRALAAARELGCVTVGLTGGEGGTMREVCDHFFCVPTPETPRVQECHIAWIHAFCELVDALILEGGDGA
jgi:D-sedoheptulose 7-phosphate isomerase